MKSLNISWFEIPVSDMERAVAFYEQLFEINISVHDLGQLKMGLLPGGNDGALVENEIFYKPSESFGPLIYLNAGEDLLNVLNKVEQAGGKIQIPKRQISESRGFMAVIIDSEGNRIALHSNSLVSLRLISLTPSQIRRNHILQDHENQIVLNY